MWIGRDGRELHTSEDFAAYAAWQEANPAAAPTPSPTAEPEPAALPQVQAADGLILRSGPGDEYESLGAVPAGEITSIIGPNGCGKSTLLKALSRTMPLCGGAVYLDGRAIAEMPTAEVARKMALLPQSPQAPAGLTVGELVALGRYPHQKGFGRLTDDDKRIIDWALSITHLGDFAARPIDALSGGQRQRAWIAMALAQDTGLILLDEPTTYLDMAHQLEVLELLQTLNRDQGKTIALVIHELNLAARFSDWMIALKSGAIRGAGTPAEVMTPALLREVFGLDALIVPDPWTARPSLVSYRLAGEE